MRTSSGYMQSCYEAFKPAGLRGRQPELRFVVLPAAGADHLSLNLPREQDDGRDAHYPKTGREFLVEIDIDLDNADLIGVIGSQLLQHWAHHAAGTTPRRPEVGHHGY